MIYFFPVLILFYNCSTHYITKQKFFEQIKSKAAENELRYENGKIILIHKNPKIDISKISLRNELMEKLKNDGMLKIYSLANLNDLECINNKNENVIIGIDKNSQIIINKNDEDKFQTYFTATDLYGDTLIGLRSRIIGNTRIIEFKDIKDIEIYSEFVNETKIKNK